jgi:hypothetical protein
MAKITIQGIVAIIDHRIVFVAIIVELNPAIIANKLCPAVRLANRRTPKLIGLKNITD